MFRTLNSIGPSTFFLDFTINPYWVYHQALKRGREPFADSVMGAIIFKTKLSALVQFIQKHEILGRVSGFV
jgi:hypothetical protein